MLLQEILISIFFTLFSIVCILFQFHRLRKPLRKIDYLKIIPAWTFFAPSPIKHDYHLLYRDRSGNKTLDWIQVKMTKNKTFLSFIWHPERRLKKKLISVSNLFNQEIKHFKEKNYRNPKAIDLSPTIPYQICLDLVLNEPIIAEDFQHRQFMVAKTRGSHIPSKPEVYFVSLYHDVSGND